jgi:uncharacterized protein YndB with AHSA1/START domain
VPTATRGTASLLISAPPAAVYALVADVTRMGEWSPECYQCTWLSDPPAPVVGARFRGYNRLGWHRWQSTAVITVAEPGREFGFTVIDDNDREETRWRYQLTPTAAGTTLTESYEFLWCPLRNRIRELPLPRNRQLRRGIRQTLERIKSAAE